MNRKTFSFAAVSVAIVAIIAIVFATSGGAAKPAGPPPTTKTSVACCGNSVTLLTGIFQAGDLQIHYSVAATALDPDLGESALEIPAQNELDVLVGVIPPDQSLREIVNLFGIVDPVKIEFP